MLYDDLFEYENKKFNYYNTTKNICNYKTCFKYQGDNVNIRLLKLFSLTERYKALLLTFSDYYLNIRNLKKELNKIKIKYLYELDSAGSYTNTFDIESNTCKNPEIEIKISNCSEIEILETLIHEFRHHITSLNNCSEKLDNENILIRKGLGTLKYNIKTKEKVRTGYGINELYNSYITMILLNNILSLKNIDINSKKFKNYLNDLKLNDPRGFYFTSSYLTLLKLSYPLLQCNSYTKLADDAAYIGDINIFKIPFNNEFKEIISFNDLSQELDYFKDLEEVDNTKRIKEYKKAIEEVNYIYKTNRKDS